MRSCYPLNDMDETLPDPIQAHGRAAVGLVPAVTCAYHPDRRFIGVRRPIGDSLELGRGGRALGDGLLDDDLLSRRHVEIEARGSVVTVHDLGSRNGTFVNGERVDTAALDAGDVLAVGSLAFVSSFGPARFEVPDDPALAGVSFALARLIEDLCSVSKEETTVLVRGETGVGKEIVARRLHELSGRTGPFVALNCGGLPDGVLASELFGHVAGSFSGADRDRVGLVETANGGTLFLDEIGDASPQLQVSLLRLLQDREYRPIGSSQLKRTDARFVAASHVRLDSAARAGRFREDLLARLRRWVVDVPPLRERREDILPIALRTGAEKLGKEIEVERPLALALLLSDWPDNVRGLRAVVEAAAIEAEAGVLRLSPRTQKQLDERTADAGLLGEPEEDASIELHRKRRPDRDHLAKRLVALDGNIKALAAELGVGRNTLYRWLRAAGLDPSAARSSK